MLDLRDALARRFPDQTIALDGAVRRMFSPDASETTLAEGITLRSPRDPLTVSFRGLDAPATVDGLDPWRAYFAALFLAVDPSRPCVWGDHADVTGVPAGTELRLGRRRRTNPVLRLVWRDQPRAAPAAPMILDAAPG